MWHAVGRAMAGEDAGTVDKSPGKEDMRVRPASLLREEGHGQLFRAALARVRRRMEAPGKTLFPDEEPLRDDAALPWSLLPLPDPPAPDGVTQWITSVEPIASRSEFFASPPSAADT